jgi:hypothetical protein
MADEAPLKKPSLLEEFWWFLKHEKKWWLGFIVFILIVLSAFIFLTENNAVMPFIYTIF